MTDEIGYTLAILHFGNHPTSGERIAIGVVGWRDNQPGVYARFGGHSRVLGMYPSMGVQRIANIIGAIEHRAQRVNDMGIDLKFGTMLEMIVSSSEPCLTWSPVQWGVTNNPDKAIDAAYQEYIGRHETQHTAINGGYAELVIGMDDEDGDD